jgi:hypothetical protein
MFRDQKATFRSYEMLMERVLRERLRLRIDHLCQPRHRATIEAYVGTNGADNAKPRLVLFEEDGEPFFRRPSNTLHANRELWEEAGIGEPLACFKLLHELAHAILHRHPHQGFTSAKHSLLRIAQDEESTEWQANVYAALSMAPPYLAIECNDRHSFHDRFNFPSAFTDFWFELRDRRPLKFTDVICPECGSYRVVKIGSLMRCVNCGQTSRLR